MQRIIVTFLVACLACGGQVAADAGPDVTCPTLPGPTPGPACAGQCFLCVELDIPESCPNTFCSSAGSAQSSSCKNICTDAGAD